MMFHNNRTENIIHFEPPVMLTDTPVMLTDTLECVCILYAQ